jgi:hypothetical protein
MAGKRSDDAEDSPGYLATNYACTPQGPALCSNALMKIGLEQQEFAPKIVGHRRPPRDTLALSPADRREDARAWKRALGELPIPKGVYRFRTHEEADRWLWQMLTRRR